MMIKQIGSVVLDTPMWWLEANRADGYISEVVATIDGGAVNYMIPRHVSSRVISISAKDGNEWQTKAILDALISFADAQGDDTFVITDYDDGETIVTFDYSSGAAIEFEHVLGVRVDDMYTGVIHLLGAEI